MFLTNVWGNFLRIAPEVKSEWICYGKAERPLSGQGSFHTGQ